MALMYPWATKEYLLWNMTIGQIILYHNMGVEIRSGKTPDEKPSLLDLDASELRAMRDEMRNQEATKAALAAKYGDI
jgi:hypothetical protein